jgi:rhodanese-related sulfurtransferase
MKTLKSFFLLLCVSALVLSVNSCKGGGNEEELGPHNKIRSAEGFKDAIDARGGFGSAQILDFRSKEAFDAGHIPGAKHIHATVVNTASNDGTFAKAVLEMFPDKSKPIFMYGGTDANLEYVVPGRISKIGYGQANSNILLGGFNAWKAVFPDLVE